MAVKEILTAPEHYEYLSSPSTSMLDTESGLLADLIRDLSDTMRCHRSLGLAAPQIGVKSRVFVVDVTHRGYAPRIFINPIILLKTQEYEVPEACESFPGAIKRVQRYRKITVEYRDENNKKHLKEFAGLLAQAIQHEYDHLNGKLLFSSVEDYENHRIDRRKRA